MTNIIDLYRQDVTENPISVSGGREYRGPCPVCGGEDRFGIFPQQNNGNGSFFCGRAKGGGKGCGIGGDAIQYLIEVRKTTYRQACDYLGIEAKGGRQATRYRFQLPEIPKARRQEFVPEDKQYPAEVADPALWVSKGMEFVEKCHEALLARPVSIAYLLARGISREGIEKFKLGFFAGEERNGMAYEPSFRPRKAWGLTDEKNEKGRSAMLMLPAGLVIPYIVDGTLHRITIRLIKKDKKLPRKKYHYVKGSIRDLFVTNPGAKSFVTSEAELDCIAIDCAAGDIVGTIGLGSSGTRPDVQTAKALERSLCILGGLDYDKAGIEGGAFWKETYPQYKRWPVPVGKDPGEAFQAGIDLRQWVVAGLPDFLVPVTLKGFEKQATCSDVSIEKSTAGKKTITAPADTCNDGPDGVQKRGCALFYANGKMTFSVENDDLAELKALLREAQGMIRIFDDGLNVAKEVPITWKYENPEKSGRISWLLNTSEAVGCWIEQMTDGLYEAEEIRG